MRDLSEDYSLLAIQGPKAVEAMQSLSSHDLSEIKFYNFRIRIYFKYFINLFMKFFIRKSLNSYKI